MSKASEPAFDPDQIDPFKEQIPFIYDRDKRYYGFVSGSGAGKTVAGVARTELNATEWNKGAMGAIIAPTGRMIKNNIIPLMRKFGYLSEWEYKSSHSDEPGIHVSGPDGGRILLLSASDERTIEYLNGLTLAFVWMDEHRDIPARATEIAVQRLRGGDYRNMYITTTPRGKNHTYDFFVGEHNAVESTWGEATIYEATDRLCVGAVPSYANPHTPDDYKDALASDLPEEIRAQEVQGQFVEIGSGIYKREMFDFVHGDNLGRQKDDYWSTVIAVDPAVEAESTAAQSSDSDYWAMTVLLCDTLNGRIFVADTGRKRGLTLQEGVDWLSAVYRQAENAEMVVESNQSQRWLAQSLAEQGINVQETYSTRDKEARLIDLSIPISSGTVKFIDWNADTEDEVGKNHPYETLVQEALAFPEGSHDDQLDSLYLGVDSVGMSASQSISSHEGYDREDRHLE